ncbi:MAG TPA: hypothetical protein VHL58_15155 [Thermoanaerobaculia bacterium]|nr:hypothetical protein [Thermoanaerobaculia bacterium]
MQMTRSASTAGNGRRPDARLHGRFHGISGLGCHRHLFSPFDGPWTFFVIYMLIMLVGVDGVRASYRLIQHWSYQDAQEGDLVVIYGAGVGGRLVVREVTSNRDVHMRPVGFIDDDPAKNGKLLNGYPVLGSLDVLELHIARGDIKGVVVASEKIPFLNLAPPQNLWV